MQQNLKPKFETHKLDGTKKKSIAKPLKDENGKSLGGFEFEEIEVDAGWMVYFPSGSSIHVWTEKELTRLGFNRDAPLVDMDSGDETAPVTTQSLRTRSEQSTARTRSSKTAQL